MVPCGLWLARHKLVSVAWGLQFSAPLSPASSCASHFPSPSATQKLHSFSSIPNNTHQPFYVLPCLGCPSPPSTCWICTHPSRSDFLSIPSNPFDVSCPAPSHVMALSGSVLSVCLRGLLGNRLVSAHLSSLTYCQYSVSCVSC